ncbi:MAG TPA: cupin domain-containing protein, partial [Jiangellaceae bacterium]|nr:cupin domain-containing protein [Jiangellaceae bacterium]
TDYSTPNYSRSERLWCHPGLRPVSEPESTVSSPIGAYRWEHTDAALTEQLLLEEEGQPATIEQGHAAVRYVNPTNGGDVMPTIRAQFHRLRPGAATATRREVGSSVFQVFEGSGSVVLDGTEHRLEVGDLFVVPSWVPWSLQAESQFDLFRFSDAPVMERLHFARTHIESVTDAQ